MILLGQPQGANCRAPSGLPSSELATCFQPPVWGAGMLVYSKIRNRGYCAKEILCWYITSRSGKCWITRTWFHVHKFLKVSGSPLSSPSLSTMLSEVLPLLLFSTSCDWLTGTFLLLLLGRFFGMERPRGPNSRLPIDQSVFCSSRFFLH